MGWYARWVCLPGMPTFVWADSRNLLWGGNAPLYMQQCFNVRYGCLKMSVRSQKRLARECPSGSGVSIRIRSVRPDQERPPTVMEATRINGCPTLVGMEPLEEPHIP